MCGLFCTGEAVFKRPLRAAPVITAVDTMSAERKYALLAL